MVIYCFETEKSSEVLNWIKLTREKSKETDFVKNPFFFKIKRVTIKKRFLLCVDILPLYPNFTIYGWFGLIGSFLILGWGWWTWPFLALGCLGFFWSSPFFYFMTKLGLRKNGYKGKIKMVLPDYFLKEVFFNGAN